MTKWDGTIDEFPLPSGDLPASLVLVVRTCEILSIAVTVCGLSHAGFTRSIFAVNFHEVWTNLVD